MIVQSKNLCLNKRQNNESLRQSYSKIRSKLDSEQINKTKIAEEFKNKYSKLQSQIDKLK